MERAKYSFEFSEDFGRRLRELRGRAGLTQAQLARLMGRSGHGTRPQLSRLEAGKPAHPSLSLIADYLRACRAGFKDVQDILDKYTSLAPVTDLETSKALAKLVEHLPAKVQNAVIEYEKKTAAAQTRPAADKPERRSKVKRELTPEERVLRMARMFGRQYQKKVLEEKLLAVLVAFGKAVPTSRRKVTCEHGRRVFSALVRSRGNEARRIVRLKQAELRAEQEDIDPEPAAAMAKAAHEAFSQLEQEGRIDWLPSDQEIAALGLSPFKVMGAEVMVEMGRVAIEDTYWKKREQFKVAIGLTVNPKLEAMRLDSELRRRQYQWVLHILDVAIDRGSAAARAEAEEVIPKARNPAVTRLATEEALKLFEERKRKLPQRPARDR
jgi:transcriptional regulator with XRE-family HTH domain